MDEDEEAGVVVDVGAAVVVAGGIEVMAVMAVMGVDTHTMADMAVIMLQATDPGGGRYGHLGVIPRMATIITTKLYQLGKY